jgi:hypothetical protein
VVAIWNEKKNQTSAWREGGQKNASRLLVPRSGEFEVLLIRFDFPRKVLTVIAFTRLRFTGAAGPFVID